MNFENCYTVQEIMKQFNVSRDRVSKIAKARNWHTVGIIGRNKLYAREDVDREAVRRQSLGYYVTGTKVL